jgi:glycosyltransferase involved in cell wall biosynthesis
MKKSFIASVVIPVFNRKIQLERAIQSVIECNGSGDVQIIVVDDCSDHCVRPENIREQDIFIRLDKNSGAAVARNVGIKASIAENIYLLDSDDYFVSRDFYADNKIIKEGVIYFCQIVSGRYKSKFPELLERNKFFDAIFCDHKYIAQTSTLVFKRNDRIMFDESLPRHQDWDLIYSHLRMGGVVARIDGVVFFDRGDKKSISRSSSGDKSKFWVNKVLSCDLKNSSDADLLIINTLGRSKNFPFSELIAKAFKLMMNKKIKLDSVLKIFYARFR